MRRSQQVVANQALKQSAKLSTKRLASEEATASATTSEAAANGPKPGSLKGLPRGEFAYICTIFAITGSSSAYFVRPALKMLLSSTSIGLSVANNMGIPNPEKASLFGGPWQFSLLYVTFMMPMYSILLFSFGTLFGRGLFFRHFLVKMWSRMLPKPLHDRLKLVLLGVGA
jgi:hypothetical protein